MGLCTEEGASSAHPQQANVLSLTDKVITEISLRLDDAKIDIPYPHLVVHLDQQK